MPTLLSHQGYGFNLDFRDQKVTKAVLPTSAGNVIVVTYDPNRNNTGGGPDGGDESGVGKFEIWYSTNRTSFSQVAQFTPGTQPNGDWVNDRFMNWSADLYSDNSVGIVWGTASGVRFRKVTFGTWSVGSETSVTTSVPSAARFESIDVSISELDSVLIAFLYSYTSGSNRWSYRLIGSRASAPTTWTSLASESGLSSQSAKLGGGAISVSWAKGTIATNTRAYCVVIGYQHSSGTDPGYHAYVARSLESSSLTETNKVALFSGEFTDSKLSNNSPSTMRRICQVSKTSNNNEFIIGAANGWPNWVIGTARYAWSGSSWIASILPQVIYEDPGGSFNDAPAITAGNQSFNFYFQTPKGTSASYSILWNVAAKLDTVTNQVITSGPHRYANEYNVNRSNLELRGGGGAFAYLSTAHDVVFHRYNNQSDGFIKTEYHQWAGNATKPFSLSPKQGSVTASSIPTLQAFLQLNTKYAPVAYRMRWEFASNSGFTTNLRTFTQSYDKLATPKNQQAMLFSDVLSEALELPQGTWWMRAKAITIFDGIGVNSDSLSFSVSHPPSPAEMEPANDTILSYFDGIVSFSWKFTDPSPTDFQTAYQVVVENNQTGSVVYDSGKVISSATTHVSTVLSSSIKEVGLRWRVRLWDKDDVAGEYGSYSTFMLSDPIDFNITSPTEGSTVASGVPQITFIPTLAGDRFMRRYRVIFSRQGVVVYNSGDIIQDVASGEEVTHTADKTYLTNSSEYTVQIIGRDNRGMDSISSPRTFLTSWVLPATPGTVSVATDFYSVEGTGGYVSVTFPTTGIDADFTEWVILRNDEVIDPVTSMVISSSGWREVGSQQETTGTVEFRDYYAPSGYRVNYRVRQRVVRFGDVVDSADSNTASHTGVLQSSGYWLMVTGLDGQTVVDVIKLHNVTSDDYTDEYEEAEYQIIGRGRHVDIGDRLGKRGTLSAQIRDTNGYSARFRKMELENIKEQGGFIKMRNPFGDVLNVYLSNLSVSRVAGVGVSEFVDVSIPYAEVYE